MKEPTVRKNPKINLFLPDWCHLHGSKIDVEKLDLTTNQLVLSGSAAKLTIIKCSELFSKHFNEWIVDWKVVQCVPYQEETNGRVRFSKEELEAAFMLSDKTGIFGDWIIERYGAHSAEQGKYIRWMNYLNIPCPGTGHDGDPNISIHITEEIQEAVKKLINQ